MGNLSSGCWDCGKDCIDVEFCSEGASYSSEDRGIKLPTDLKVVIHANPAYWGFEGVLTSGYATFTDGHFDYFEGFDKNWWGSASCSDTSVQQGRNEKRPDVTYRSVFDPDTGITTHYNGNTVESTGRGGAEVYLINRAAGQVGAGGTEDLGTCPEIDPTKSFKRFPENFGWGNKINFDSSLYKNLTGAWRMIDYSACYDSGNIQKYDSPADLAGQGNYSPSGEFVTCSGKPKQNFGTRENYLQYYDPAKVRVTGLNYLETGVQDTSCSIKGCLPDGHIAGQYAGEMSHNYDTGNGNYDAVFGGFFRSSGAFNNLKLYLNYRDWSNGGDLVSAFGLRNGQTLLVKNSVDPSYDNFYTIANVQHSPSTASVPYSYTIVDLAGTYGSGYINVEISGAQGSWNTTNTYDPNTCCGLTAYGVDDQFKDIHCETVYHSDFRRVFNDSKFKIQSNRSPEYRETYDYGTVTPHSNVNGPRKDKSYIGVDASGNPSGTIEGNGYTSFFPKELPYYGPFFETDTCDNTIRGQVKKGTMISKNATCYTKKSELEVFPDCYTQYYRYRDCTDGIYKYKINRVPRLSFVYRGCDFHDSCTFDVSGRPYSEPANIEDLRRGRGGEEIHMYLNLGEAWASIIEECSCPGSPAYPGTEESLIYHVGVNSPVTFPSFPDFDLEPTKYGCDDDTFQLAQYLKYAIGSDDTGSSPDAGLLSGDFCSPVPQLAASCNVRQPYTTYGYIMNLCGKEGRQRRKIIEAFNNLHQSGSYTHLSPNENIDEPMYRGFTVPAPFPYSSGNYWQVSGLLQEDIILQKTGETVGYWGLTDGNGALVAPYYKTESGEFKCPGTSTPSKVGFINFSDSGNYIDGWPTDDVPFLVQIEAETRCVGCTTSMMETGNLTLTIDTLPTKFLHQISHASAAASTLVGGMYGYNHCNNGGFSLDGTDSFHCTSGFADNTCLGSYTGYSGPEVITRNSANGDKHYQNYGLPNSGQTCPAMSGLEITLSGYRLGTSQYPKGWKTGDGVNDYIELFRDTTSNFLNEQPDNYRLANGGMALMGKIGLGCPDMNVGGESSQIDLTMPLHMNTAYLDIASADAVTVSFGGQGCPGHYPTKLSDNQNAYGRNVADLMLYGRFWAVAPEYVDLFNAFDPHQFRNHAEVNDNITTGGRIQTVPTVNGLPVTYNLFGLCIGDKIYKHGCFLESGADGVTMGSNTHTINVGGVEGMFFGVSGAECANLNLCNTCDKVDYPQSSYVKGEVICDSNCPDESDGGFLGMGNGSQDGDPNSADWNISPPNNYQFNNCFCLCKDPVLVAEYTVTGINGEDLMTNLTDDYYNLGIGYAYAYWYSMSRSSTNETGVSGLGPFMVNTGPPAHPNIAYNLSDVKPEDWFSYSHGANKLVTGIQHDLVPPRLTTNTTTPGEGCNTLTVKTCETGYTQFGDTDAGCNIDPTKRTNTANCKNPIYAGQQVPSVKTNATVNRKACFPEVVTVNKIECKSYLGQYPYYDLVVSREYYSHDRTWRTVKDLGGSNGCGKKLVGAYTLIDENGCTGCTPLPYAVPSDLVTPVYETPCSIHPSSGAHVSQDFTWTSVSASETGTAPILCNGVCQYQWFGAWNFDAGASTCSCNCSPPSSPGSTMGEIGYGTCS